MTRSGPSQRWALSFADICLLLLGFFVILHARAQNEPAVASSIRDAFGGPAQGASLDLAAEALFEPGEAVFRPGAERRFEGFGRAARLAGRDVVVETAGSDRGTHRFDAWELAAARAAAVARAVRAGGLEERRIALVMRPEGAQRPQHITVRTH